ncbi:hypothetical protein V6N13_124395 [Hibiscus sabdariffa]
MVSQQQLSLVLPPSSQVALDIYQPGLVLASNLSSNRDQTQELPVATESPQIRSTSTQQEMFPNERLTIKHSYSIPTVVINQACFNENAGVSIGFHATAETLQDYFVPILEDVPDFPLAAAEIQGLDGASSKSNVQVPVVEAESIADDQRELDYGGLILQGEY